MRLNTPFKNKTARAWCEEMTGTSYDQWRFPFLRQKRFERSLAAGVSSLAELAESPVRPPAEPQLKLLDFDDERAPLAAKRVLSLYSLYSPNAAAGYFAQRESVEPEGWSEAQRPGRLSEQMFLCRVHGRSMEPALLVRHRRPADPDTGDGFTVVEVLVRQGGNRRRQPRSYTCVTLTPTNPECQPTVLTREDAASLPSSQNSSQSCEPERSIPPPKYLA